MTSSSRCCRRRTLLDKCPIDPPWSSCLWRASSPVRQHANSRRKNTLAQPTFPYIFPSALRAAGRSMEAAPSSWAMHSDTVNLLSKLRSSSLFGTGRSRVAVPRHSLERSRRRRLRLDMGGCFPSCVAQESIRRRHVACHLNASRSLPRSPRAAAHYGQHAHEGHAWPVERSICAESCSVVRLFVLLCSCPIQTAAGGVEGKNYEYFLLHAIVDSTTY
jgi:hypothetical protein